MAEMRMKRMLLRAPVVAGLLATGAWVAATSPASATPGHPANLHYWGPAPGSVTCSLALHVKFNPPLTNGTGGETSEYFVGSATGCSSTAPGVSITHGKVTGYFNGSPLACSGPPEALGPNAVSMSVQIKWSGRYTALVNGSNYLGAAHFTNTTMTFSTEALVGGPEVGFTMGTSDSQVISSSSFDGNGPGDSAPNSGVASASASSTSPIDTVAALTPHCQSLAEGGHGIGIKVLILNSGTMTVGPPG
jgi:hypothetical protein